MEITEEYLCIVIRFTLCFLLYRIFIVRHRKADIIQSRHCTFASYLCTPHFTLEQVGKMDLQLLYAKYLLFLFTELDTGQRSALQVFTLLSYTQETTRRHVLQMKSINTCAHYYTCKGILEAAYCLWRFINMPCLLKCVHR